MRHNGFRWDMAYKFLTQKGASPKLGPGRGRERLATGWRARLLRDSWRRRVSLRMVSQKRSSVDDGVFRA